MLSNICGQGLAESYADEVAGRALQRQNVLANLHQTVQHRQDRDAQQIAAHQALVDRQARHCTCCWLFFTVRHHSDYICARTQGLHCYPAANASGIFTTLKYAFGIQVDNLCDDLCRRIFIQVVTCNHNK